tara:strand:- start:5511 stop:6302 length:792 start_codon:yes stop_codon:yes gene_type:complete
MTQQSMSQSDTKAAFLIKAHHVSISYQDTPIITDIDLEIAAGQIITLIGPNGAGKSTLLKALLGLIPVTSGHIERAQSLAIGYMPQKLSISPTIPMDVKTFLSLSEKHSRQTILNALKETSVDHLIHQEVQHLSGGEWQRVLLARALLRRPDILVLDEPVQGVDINGQAAIYQLINELRHRYHCAVLMVSHDLHLVMAQTDQVYCLNKHICCSGHPETVSQHPAYQQLFTPYEASRIAIYTHHHDHQHDLCGDVEHHKEKADD